MFEQLGAATSRLCAARLVMAGRSNASAIGVALQVSRESVKGNYLPVPDVRNVRR
jgi:hypothetical protein